MHVLGAEGQTMGHPKTCPRMAQSQDGHRQPTVVGKLSPLSPVGPVASEDLMFLVLPFVENPWVMVEVTPV